MPLPTARSATSPDRQWFIVGRWQQYYGEVRVNLLRALAIASFYLVELINFGVLQVVSLKFHQAVTAICFAWLLVCVVVFLCLRRGFLPAWLKYVTTVIDLVLLGSIMTVGQGPQSPLVAGLFLVLALAGLRFDLHLIWFTTFAAVFTYLGLAAIGSPDWFAIRDFGVPRSDQLVVITAIGWTGILIGQMVRHARRMALHFSTHLGALDNGD
jgi:hypothetical protein